MLVPVANVFLDLRFLFFSKEACVLNGNVDSRVTGVGLPQVPVQIKKRFLQDLNFEVACELGASKIMGRNVYRRLTIQPADFGLLDLQV